MKIKTSKGDRTFQVINILIFAIFAIICAYPFYYLIINSISANDLSASGKVNFLPHGFQLENYVKVFQLNGLGTAAMVSLGRTVIGTICTVLLPFIWDSCLPSSGCGTENCGIVLW